MRIAISGSESFVGRELITHCLKRDTEVIGFDLVRASDLNYEFHKADLTAPNIAEIIPEGVDAVVHLAALSRDQDCAGRAYECFEANVMGTLNLMRAAKQKNAKQFIFASSEWVYESFMPGEPKDEDALVNIAAHSSEYALSKLVSEANLRQAFQRGFCPTTILRFAIVYGPRKTNWSAVESIMSAVKNNDTVTVGSLKSGRRFIHVADIARGIIKSFGLQSFDIVNLSGDRVVTIADIVEESEKLLNKKVNVVESNPSQVSVRNPSNEKANRLLNWKPELGLRAGLETLIGYV